MCRVAQVTMLARVGRAWCAYAISRNPLRQELRQEGYRQSVQAIASGRAVVLTRRLGTNESLQNRMVPRLIQAFLARQLSPL